MTGPVKLIETKSDFDEFLKKAGDKLVVIDFFAEWCGPCKVIKPEVQKFAEEFTDVCFGKVDVDDNPDVAESEDISAMPTFIFYKNGKKVDEFTGADKKKLKKKIEENK